MKLDLTKLPVLEGIVGFLSLAIVLTFVGAFAATESSGGEEAAPTTAATGTPGDDGTPGAGDYDVSLQDDKFEPDAFTVAAGAGVTFNITNDGDHLHNMHISPTGDEYNEELCEGDDDPCSDPPTLSGGESATLDWDAPASPGTYQFRCDFHAGTMKGEITVE